MAASAALDLIIKLEGADKATKGLKNMAKESGGLNKAFGTMAKVGLGAAVAGIGLIGAGMAKALGEASEWENGMAQLNAVLKSTKGVAGQTEKSIADLSAKLSASNGMSKFSDDAVLAGSNILLTFTNIKDDVFPGTMKAAVNMAQAMGTDVTSAAMQLGKALNDPLAGLTKLTKQGVQFTQAQKDQVKAMVAAGNTMGAQKVILAELETQFGGSAAAAAGTFSGKMITLQEKLNDVFQAVGEKLMPVVSGFVDFLSKPETMASIQGFADNLITGIGEAAKVIGPIIGTVVENVGKFFTAVTSGDKEQVKTFFSDLGGGPDSIIAKVGSVLTDAATKAWEFGSALASGDFATARGVLTDLAGGDGSLLGNAVGFLFDAAKNAGDFALALTGLGGSESMKTFLANIGKMQVIPPDATLWDAFWGNVNNGYTKWADAYNAGDAKRSADLAALNKMWHDGDAARDANVRALGGLWDTFSQNVKRWTGEINTAWGNVGFKVKTSAEDGNAYWVATFDTIQPKADTYYQKLLDMGIIAPASAVLAKKGWEDCWLAVNPLADACKTILEECGPAAKTAADQCQLEWEECLNVIKPKAEGLRVDMVACGVAGETAAGTAKTAWDGFLSGVATSATANFLQAGKNAGQGFINGMNAMKAGANAMAASLAKGAKDALDAGLRAKSPSLETYESGQWAGDGFINGMRDKIPEADRAAYDLGKTVIAALGKVAPEATTEGVKFNDSFVNGMKSKLPEADVEAYNMGKQVLAALHKGVVPGLEEAGLFFREYFGSLSQNWQIAMAMMKEDTARGVADILAELARLNGTSSNGVPLNNGVPAYQQSPGGSGPPSGGGGGHGRPPQMRAWGGNITAGMPYWVGELGRELIVPRTSGRVIPNGDLQIPERGRNYGGDLGQATTTIIIPVMLDGKKIAEVVSPHLEQRRALRNAYSI